MSDDDAEPTRNQKALKWREQLADQMFAEATAFIYRRRELELADRAYFRQQHHTLLTQMTWGACLLNLGTAAATLTLSKDVLKGYPVVMALALGAFALGFLRSVSAHALLAVTYTKIALSADSLLIAMESHLQGRSKAMTALDKTDLDIKLSEDTQLWKIDRERVVSPGKDLLDLLKWGLGFWSIGVGLVASSVIGPPWFDFAGRVTWWLTK